MISLERLVELRSDSALMHTIDGCVRHSTQLLGFDSEETIRGIVRGEKNAAADAKRMHEVISLAIYEEARRPLVDFLRELDASALVRVRPRLHQRLKELIK